MVNKKLQTIADLIPDSRYLVDVGCDHGYLGIYALLNNKVDYVLNLDINAEPLEQARRNFQKYNLLNQASFVLNDGLKNQKFDKQTTVAIAGMGANLIIKVLEQQTAYADAYILSANSDVIFLRTYLYEHNYLLVNEEIVYEKGNYYFVFLAKHLNKKTDYHKKDYYISRSLYTRNDRVYRTYLQARYDYLSQLDIAKVSQHLRDEYQYLKGVILNER
ncbi:class I SAM-dependent methyltransferase [Ureaplasma sp. ES3154-GEN]|uniref:tRNA (adenine(22)-N(1))-methyltransferase n=1 Tax=Ureaplasma sp. ES3154-GEN TaxID=2984844 RepID=UPI0021E99904|nr:class I SAM-dependent methyltransferase [Ureaplasma sp. ES3154-GEN]MCV3743564.1 class I SAM-dependent methyltransferase [Ureaplasma sp. ES3154-GEN]